MIVVLENEPSNLFGLSLDQFRPSVSHSLKIVCYSLGDVSLCCSMSSGSKTEAEASSNKRIQCEERKVNKIRPD